MKFSVTGYNGVAVWKWDTSSEPHKLYHYARGTVNAVDGGFHDENEDGGAAFMDDDDEDEDDVCGICRLAFESCCPECKVPGDDCPLIWGECTHVFHMHCLLKWIDTESSKQQCPMDRRPWVTADRKPDKLPTTVDGAPMASVAPGPIPAPPDIGDGEEDEDMDGEVGDDGDDDGDHGGEAFMAVDAS